MDQTKTSPRQTGTPHGQHATTTVANGEELIQLKTDVVRIHLDSESSRQSLELAWLPLFLREEIE